MILRMHSGFVFQLLNNKGQDVIKLCKTLMTALGKEMVLK